jgi:hypothetical protein
LREEALDRILWEIRFGTFRKTDYVIKEIDRISAETFSAIPDKLRRRSSAVSLLRLWIRIPPETWMFVCVSVVCCQVEVSATD